MVYINKKITLISILFKQLISIPLLFTPMAVLSADGETQFDTNTLKQLGYSTEIADFFSKDARFLPGHHNVTILVNSSLSYQAAVTFNNEGELCVDQKLIRELKLVDKLSDNSCANIMQLWLEAKIKSDPGLFRIELTLPEEAFDKQKMAKKAQLGGYALLVNYNLFSLNASSSNNKTTMTQGVIEPGVNLSNWIIRSRGDISKLSDSNYYSYTTNQTYGLRAIESLRSVLEVGEISFAGSTLNGLPITGSQLYSDSAQVSMSRLLVPIQGTAKTNATIEISQRGQVIYRTMVPPGPFSLSNISNISSSIDTQVLIIEQDGQETRFMVPNLQVANMNRTESTYVVGMGRYRSRTSSQQPVVFGVEANMVKGSRFGMTTSTLISEQYNAINLLSLLPISHQVDVSGGGSYAKGRENEKGFQLNLQGNMRLTERLSTSLTALYQQADYRNADESFSYEHYGQNIEQSNLQNVTSSSSTLRNSNSATLSWSHALFGAFSYSVLYNQYYGSTGSNIFQSITTNHRIGRVNLNIGAQFNQDNRSLYLSISMPLGKGAVTGRMQSINDSRSFGTTYYSPLEKNSRYSLDVSSTGERRGVAGTINNSSAYTQISAGFSLDNNQSRSTSFSANGGMAFANNTFVTSNQPIGDTFAIMTIPEQSNISIEAPGGGTAVTNYFGTALLPTITPYTPIKAQVNTLKLPLNIRLNTTVANMMLARGSVASRRFEVTETKQLLLTVRNNHGEDLPMGLTVVDENDQFIGTLVGDGNIILVNEDIGKILRMKFSDGQECKVKYDVPESFDPEALYEEVDAVCY